MHEILTSFNLNLLECKSVGHRGDQTTLKVLISTYWNVNPLALLGTALGDAVLISTYWNVNKILSLLQLRKNHRFNLNLLECKC